ncbi:tyrosine--tRNA ligase [Sciscionella marina]|uniref:tyrosine--tRNA ligase n=1 Tax=Sciscionella marina TaxID=508770 RepID=UPI000373CA61|nr:tyrosine--tRNA ligase [Sciscionella marina]
MSRLSQSVDRARALLRDADLAAEASVRELLAETTYRRGIDLSDLSPAEQAELIGARTQQLHPSTQALTERIAKAAKEARPFVAKLGIDPTGAEVHLGHAVPMIMLGRFERMGHDAVLIVGDMTATIGDPSGRSDERPTLTEADIERNLATYREQVGPFFDFERAKLRRNGDWLRRITLPRIIEITSQIPVSMSLQREDFRTRLDAGHGLSVSELLYSVVMALDSVEIHADVELGGIDQFLNMQMGRKVMEICGQAPEVVAATSLIEGTDGTGAKMSKSKGNYVPLTAPAGEVFGKLMSIPDRLVAPYFRALSEWQDSELALVEERLTAGALHPMDLKKVLAGEVTAAIHGVEAAMTARKEFVARFSKQSFAGAGELPAVADLGVTVAEALRELGFAKSNGEVRRLAQQNGLRLVAEADGGEQHQVTLSADDIREPLESLRTERLGAGKHYLKAGRKLATLN